MQRITKVFVIKNDLAEIDPLVDGILGFCRGNGIHEDICHDIRLAVDEAVSNTIKYGYRDQQAHEIHVKAGLADQKLVLEIEDDAEAFNPLEVPRPNVSLPIEKRPAGGLGIYLLRTVMDQVEYERSGGKNILRMAKLMNRN